MSTVKFCQGCGVPENIHGTSCGWLNANTVLLPEEQLIPSNLTPADKAYRYFLSVQTAPPQPIQP